MKALVLLLSLISVNAFSQTYCFGKMEMVPDFQIAPYFQAVCDGKKVKSKTEVMYIGGKQESRLESQVTAKLQGMGFVKVSKIRGLAVYEKSQQTEAAPHCLIMNNKKSFVKSAQHKAEYFLSCSDDGLKLSLRSKQISDIESVLNNNRYVKVADTEHGPLYKQK